MVNNSDEIRTYAILASSFLISGLSKEEMRNLHSVILFGSVAQETAIADSDVDLFFDVDMSKSAQKRLKIKLNRAAEAFYLSNIAFGFKLKKISNQLSINIGKLDEWPDLQRSIISTGIILYGKYFAKIEEKAKVMFSMGKIGKNEGALLNKLYGYKSGKKHYPGFIKKMSGQRLGRTFIVPSRQKFLVMDILKKYEVDYGLYEIWMD